ncbi:MAG TPA: NADH-quinone oxidoreductase subunit N [Pirellulales bacterium]|jgi:NADH-quinone oxidoreductase subunit N|nr:NADH-quinone oxidoreductase subunit N [Pirellulales bacterium]
MIPLVAQSSLSQLVDALLRDTAAVSLPAFRTELTLCASIVLLLLVRVFFGSDRVSAFFLALVGSLVALYFALPWTQPAGLLVDGHVVRHEFFTGMLVYDSLALYFRALLMFFAVLFVLLTRLTGIPDREDAPDFYVLMLGATLGMCLMVTANHLLTIFLGVEMASVPSYALAGMLKGRRKSSEAALKYSVYGAGAAGIMLYGISLLAGVLGSCHLPTMANQLAAMVQSGHLGDSAMVLVLGGLMVMVGLAFKLSAVPFHFWCPDVFEGASAEVNAFLSVASKAAALALLIRVVVGFGFIAPANGVASVADMATPVAFSVADNGKTLVAERVASDAANQPVVDPPHDARIMALAPARNFMAILVAFLAAITCTFGNMAAYGQTNIKRLLAYSTIAHAGYMMMPIAAGLVLAGKNPAAAETAFAAVPFYAGVYLFMNLGAFAIVALLRNQLRSEEIADYAGLVRNSPGLVIALGVIVFSLVGIPPLAGFAGKLVIFSTLVDAINHDAARGLMITLLVIGGLNTALALFYYLRVIKVMTFEPEPDERPPFTFPLVSFSGAYIVAISAPVLLLGLWWNDLYVWAAAATAHLLW